MTDDKLNIILGNTRCCLGKLTCRIMQKAMNGTGYAKTMYVAKEVSLYIFAIETQLRWPDSGCMSNKEKVASRLNKLCGCDCAALTGTYDVAEGQHTVREHTLTEHTI